MKLKSLFAFSLLLTGKSLKTVIFLLLSQVYDIVINQLQDKDRVYEKLIEIEQQNIALQDTEMKESLFEEEEKEPLSYLEESKGQFKPYENESG